VNVSNEEKMKEYQPKLHADGNSDTKTQIYTVQQEAAI
jgi:hypothetical protein